MKLRDRCLLMWLTLGLASCGGSDGDLTAGWSSVAEAAFGGQGVQEMSDVAASESVLVAVGRADGAKARDVGTSDAAVWVSSTGLEWTRVGNDSVFREIAAQSMMAVTAGGPGFVAVGAAERTHQDDAAVWISEDGYSWSRVEDSAGAFATGTSTQMWDVTTGGPGLVAVGFMGAVDTFDAAVWVSPDGTAWTRVIDDSLAGRGNAIMLGVVALDGGRLVAVGVDESNGTPLPSVWTSTDGLSWEQGAPFDSAEQGGTMSAVASWEGGLVAAGRDESGDDLDAAVWISPDGFTWQRVADAALGGPGDQAIAAIAEIEGELVAVGYERRTDRNAIVWLSSDGLTWTRSTDETFAAPGFQELTSLSSTEERLIAVGYSGAVGEWDAAVWLRSR